MLNRSFVEAVVLRDLLQSDDYPLCWTEMFLSLSVKTKNYHSMADCFVQDTINSWAKVFVGAEGLNC